MIHPHPLLITKIIDMMKVFRFAHTCTDMEILHIYDSDIQHVLWGGYFIFSSGIPNPNNELSSHLICLYFRITWKDFFKIPISILYPIKFKSYRIYKIKFSDLDN